jgi:hypothetical protein
MAQTVTDRVQAIKNTPGTGEQVSIAEINSAFDKFDNHFVPACKIHNSTTQAIGSGAGQIKLQFNTTLIDTYAARSEGAMADLSNDLIKIRKAGLYWVRANVLWLTGTAAGILRTDLLINGSTNNATFCAGTAQATSQTVEGLYLLAVNDEITAGVQQTTGASRTLDRNTYQNIYNLEAYWVGGGTEV